MLPSTSAAGRIRSDDQFKLVPGRPTVARTCAGRCSACACDWIPGRPLSTMVNWARITHVVSMLQVRARSANLRPWRGDRWGPVVSQAIERRLRGRREELAKILRLDDQTELDDLLGDLAAGLRRCWAILRDVNMSASDPQVRVGLESLLARPERISAAIWEADPNTRGVIEDFLPAHSRFLEASDDQDILLACHRALLELPRAGKGRPKGRVDHATRHFARMTAELLRHYTGKDPTRIADGGGLSYGAYGDFVKTLLSGVPGRLRRSRTGMPKGHEYVTRLEIQLLKPR